MGPGWADAGRPSRAAANRRRGAYVALAGGAGRTKGGRTYPTPVPALYPNLISWVQPPGTASLNS
jgi:hypothetical protein